MSVDCTKQKMSVIAVHWQFVVFVEELLTVVLMELNVKETAA